MKYVIQKDLFGQFFILETIHESKKADTFESEQLAKEEVQRRILRLIQSLHKNLEHIPVEGQRKVGEGR